MLIFECKWLVFLKVDTQETSQGCKGQGAEPSVERCVQMHCAAEVQGIKDSDCFLKIFLTDTCKWNVTRVGHARLQMPSTNGVRRAVKDWNEDCNGACGR